ncbi:hypothetical protein Efla_002432 [Eimeria flavescens]
MQLKDFSGDHFSEGHSDARHECTICQPSFEVAAKWGTRESLTLQPAEVKASRKHVLVAIVLITFSLVITSCFPLRTRALRAGLTLRRLADEAEGDETDDEALDTILNECQDIEEASGCYATTLSVEEVSGLVDLTQTSSAAWVGVIPNILEEFEVVDVATEPVVQEVPGLPEQSLALGGVRGKCFDRGQCGGQE